MVRMVDAIFEGKIVNVPEEYALKEGLLVLGGRKMIEEVRMISPVSLEEKKLKEKVEGGLRFDDFRRPLGWRNNQVVKDLVENFHWKISRARRTTGMSRKDLARKINLSENEVKLIENGTFPFKDYILIHRIQEVLGIDLRKDGLKVGESARSKLDSEETISSGEERLDVRKEMSFDGDEIELI